LLVTQLGADVADIALERLVERRLHVHVDHDMDTAAQVEPHRHRVEAEKPHPAGQIRRQGQGGTITLGEGPLDRLLPRQLLAGRGKPHQQLAAFACLDVLEGAPAVSSAARTSPTLASVTSEPRAAVISIDGSCEKRFGTARSKAPRMTPRIRRFFHKGYWFIAIPVATAGAIGDGPDRAGAKETPATLIRRVRSGRRGARGAAAEVRARA
jgi:hypothetical protein